MENLFRRAIFKLLRLIRARFCVVQLDFPELPIFMVCENQREFSVRARSCAKEPETTEWLKEHCRVGELFFDIGANVGAYTLVGAALGSDVYSFEPSFANFNRLNENVTLNNFDSKIKTFPIAFSRSKKIGSFQFLDSTVGSSACYYNESGKFHSKLSVIQNSKSVMVYTLDKFIEEFDVPCPTLMKIDVDGAEMEILEGARKVLNNALLKQLIVEVDLRIVQESDFLRLLQECNFKKLKSYSRGTSNVFNYVFVRG